MSKESFNELYPKGSKFIFMPAVGARGGKVVETTSEAWDVCGSVVVKVSGVSGGVDIDHLTPLTQTNSEAG